MKKLVFVLLSGVFFISCQKAQNTQSSDTALQDSAESAVSALSEMPDEVTQNLYSYKSPQFFDQIKSSISDLLIPQALAAQCIRPRFASCVSGVQTETYNSCNFGATSYLLSGDVSLSYSDASCGFNTVGESVNRTYDVVLSGPRGGDIAISSANSTAYTGDTMGGGGVLSVTNTGWNLSILGKHKVLSYNGFPLFDHSIRTTSPLQISNSLSRSGRLVDGGTIQVFHNIAKFTASYSPHNLTWISSCCYPVSGSLDATYTGRINGTGTVTFNGCGTATVEKNGVSNTVQLSYCE